jgi:hypothetical protein
MKLSFEAKREFAILRVSERITENDFKVLRAGIAKIAKENAKGLPLLLDLTPARAETPIYRKLRTLPYHAFNSGLDLLIVSEDTTIAVFRKMSDATQHLLGGKTIQPLREQILSGILKELELQRKELSERADKLREKHITLGHLPDENKHLEDLLGAMEKHAWSLIGSRDETKPGPKDPRLISLRRELEELMVAENFAVSAYLGGADKK